METLSTVIKFAAGYSGNGDTSANATGTTATGDFGFMIIAAIVLLLGACVVGAVLYLRQKLPAGNNSRKYAEYISQGANNKFAIPVIAAITCVLALSIAAIGLGQTKAIADENGALTGAEQIIGTVDKDAGAVTFSEGEIKNTSDTVQEIKGLYLSAAEGITTINDVSWIIMIGDTKVFEGVVEKGIVSFEGITVGPGQSVIMTVSIKDMSAELAKSLIAKDVAIATTMYGLPVKYNSVSLTKDAGISKFTDASGTELTSPINVEQGKSFSFKVERVSGKIIDKVTCKIGQASPAVLTADENGVYTTGAITGATTISATSTFLRQVTGYSYTNSFGDTQKLNFVPAFPNTNKTYLKDNGVKFYKDIDGTQEDTEINEKIDNGCTMSDLYSVLVVDPSAAAKECKTLYVKANSGVEFFGTVDEAWTEVFYKADQETGGPAEGLQVNFKKWLDDNSIKTVYFDNNDDTKTSDIGNWNVKTVFCPTLNGADYSHYNNQETTFYHAYQPTGSEDDGILSIMSTISWGAKREDDMRVYSWNYPADGEWNPDNAPALPLAAVLRLTF